MATTPVAARRWFTLSQPVRRAVLTAHIIVSVGLLGDSAGFLAVAIRGATTNDSELARASWELAPASTAMLEGTGGGETNLVLAAVYDVLALATATALSVYKPGRGWRRGS